MNKRSQSISSGNENESLRANFKESLGKLALIATRDQAYKQLKTLILQNKTTSNLRIFLSVLSQNRNKHAQSQINIIGFIVEKYGSSLLDPLDKQPSIQKTTFRITQMLLKFFSTSADIQTNIQVACQKSWIQIYLSVLLNEGIQLKKKILFNNLQALINGGGGKVSQITAQFVIQGLLETALAKQDHEFFKQIAKRTLVLFLKTTVIHYSTLTCLQSILSFFGINNLIPLLQGIVGKILQYISLATPNSNGYKIKSQACNALALIGDQIDKNGLDVYSKIVKHLQNLATDKVWAVQATGRKALTVWKNKKQEWENQFLQKQEKYAQDYEQFQGGQQGQQGNNNNINKNYRQNAPQTAQQFYRNKNFNNVEQQQIANQYTQYNPSNGQQGQNPKIHQNNWLNPASNQQQGSRNMAGNIQVPLVLETQNNGRSSAVDSPSRKRTPNNPNQYSNPPITSNQRPFKTYNQGFYQPSTQNIIQNSHSQLTTQPHKNRFLHKNTGGGGGNNVQTVQHFYQKQGNSKQTYAKKMQQIKKSIYNQNKTLYQQNNSIQYDETIAWQEGKSLPNFNKLAVKGNNHVNDNNMRSNITQPEFKANNKVQKQIEPQNPDLIFVQKWQEIVQVFQKGQKQKSVKLLLEMDDDIYFLRFLLQHGQDLLKDLTRPTSAKLLKKMLSIHKTNFMEQMLFKMVGETAKIKAGQLLTNSQNLSIMRNLEKCQKIEQLQNFAVKVKNMYEKSLNV